VSPLANTYRLALGADGLPWQSILSDEMVIGRGFWWVTALFIGLSPKPSKLNPITSWILVLNQGNQEGILHFINLKPHLDRNKDR
jgi:hypothetical protein